MFQTYTISQSKLITSGFCVNHHIYDQSAFIQLNVLGERTGREENVVKLVASNKNQVKRVRT